MNADTVAQYRSWFTRFVQDHAEQNEQDQQNIVLKEEHTHQVSGNARRIAAELGLDERASAIAETIALFHDVGRFPQYRRYRTFQDSLSVNHAVLGAQVLLERNVLRDLPARERSLTVRTVALHNVFTLPQGLDGEVLLQAKLVRDADKLDIWRVFMELLDRDTVDWPSAAGLGLPDTPEHSPGVLDSLEQREMVQLTSLRTLNDFKLLQLAWIYDLNFAPSLRMVIERGVIDRLSATIPQTPKVGRVLGNLRQYVAARLAGTAT
jgi:putative nucleotidyltransferase with HDIG domain